MRMMTTQPMDIATCRRRGQRKVAPGGADTWGRPGRAIGSAAFLAVASLVCTAAAASAQGPVRLALEVNVGAAAPMGELANNGQGLMTQPGVTFGANVTALPFDGVGAFAGYRQSRFGCADCGMLGLDELVFLDEFEGGVQLELPGAGLRARPWVRAGLVQQKLSFSGAGDRMSSRPAIGYTVAAGAYVAAVGALMFNPAVRFVSGPAEFNFNQLPRRSVDVSAAAFDVGFAFRFW